MKCPSTADSLKVFSGIRANGRNFHACFIIKRKETVLGYEAKLLSLLKQLLFEFYMCNKVPVAYRGTEWVRKPPAATTQRVCRRRTSSRALSGVSKFDPLAFFTGANSSSRSTYNHMYRFISSTTQIRIRRGQTCSREFGEYLKKCCGGCVRKCIKYKLL